MIPRWAGRQLLGGVAIVVVLAVALLACFDLRDTTASTESTRTQLRSTRSANREETAELRRALGVLGVAEEGLAARTTERDRLIEEAGVVAGQLTEARDALVQAGGHLLERGSAAEEIRACLDGISAGLNALAVGDSRTALARIRSIGGACEAAA